MSFIVFPIHNLINFYDLEDNKEMCIAEIIDTYRPNKGMSRIEYEYFVNDEIYFARCNNYHKSQIGDSVKIVYNKLEPKSSMSYNYYQIQKRDNEESYYLTLLKPLARYMYEIRK